jgi:hypothetical protein
LLLLRERIDHLGFGGATFRVILALLQWPLVAHRGTDFMPGVIVPWQSGQN